VPGSRPKSEAVRPTGPVYIHCVLPALGFSMSIQRVSYQRVSYSFARAHLGELLRTVKDNREPIIITRRGHRDVAVLPAAELNAMRTTIHLLRSPENSRRLFRALDRALSSSFGPELTADP